MVRTRQNDVCDYKMTKSFRCDKIILSIIPVVLGSGVSLFKDVGREVKLELIKTSNYDKLVELHYKVSK